MNWMPVLLAVLLTLELAARIVLEIRERRLTQIRGGLLSLLQLVPLINDIVPLPENRSDPPCSEFISKHEEGHAVFHHGLLRNFVKISLLLLAVWFLAFLLASRGLNLIDALLWLHLVAIPFNIAFRLYCWYQEFEADRYAFEKLGKKAARNAMRDLAVSEIPYTKLFAVVYRDHPPVAIRSQRMLHKEIKAQIKVQ